MTIEKEFRQYLIETCDSVIITEKADLRRTFYVRPSSLPYCGLRRFLTLAEHGIKEEGTMNAQSLYYTSTGSSIHGVFQKVLGKGGKIVGDWICPTCKYERLLKTYRICPKCHTSMTSHYRELALGHLAWRGHLDGLYIARNGDVFVIDYKTCTLLALHRMKSDHWKPYLSYSEQQDHYVCLVEQAIKRKVAGWILVYLSRDNPFKQNSVYPRLMTENRKQVIRGKIELVSDMHKHLFKIQKVSEVAYLFENKRCSSLSAHNNIFPFDPCPYAGQCFNKSDMVAKAKEIVNTSKWLPLVQWMPNKIKRELYAN